jgi:hypothetical protein
MNMKSLLLIFAPLFTFSQGKLTIVKFDHGKIQTSINPGHESQQDFIVLSNNDSLFVGSLLKLGKGTLPNGDYEYIATSSNTPAAKLKRTTTLTELKIVKLKRKGDEKYGYKYFIITEGSYLVQLESAVATGEIIFENGPIKK